ncbi:MAG: 30S ribosomal protein S18 [Chloroherpetonaceae bacterium]|nr:30S ribosomal protein S18 [Chloroherpetonaceae bacterium]MCS7210620.1 30S ribosomal protein S18 [Chloroherpetonaceae bacterium]MDW8020478.1 30S ribosomal protein S18 [Chloroherpetonaceae bacterium]MDW8465349.1 30S ribosomal protein S18 [Chloroherpetonaceae bacterium]
MAAKSSSVVRPAQRISALRSRNAAAAAKNQVVFFDYRDERKLRRFINEQGKIIPRRITGLSAKEQRLLTKSIKWARHLAIIPFVSDQIK